MVNLPKEAAGRHDDPCYHPTRRAKTGSTLPNLTAKNSMCGGRFQVSQGSKGCVDWVPATVLEKGDWAELLFDMYRRTGFGWSSEESLR